MKVLHIGYSDSGGAGKGMLNLHNALRNAGVDSRVLVAHKASNDDEIVCAAKNINFYSYSKFKPLRLIQKLIRKQGRCLNQIEEYERMIKQIPASQSCFFTFPITHYDISQHPLVKEADIIHLHWIANFVDYPSFFRNVSQSIVWTLRDMNPGLGGFHTERTREEYKMYYASIEKDFLEIKRKGLCGCNDLTLVAMSDVMESFCSRNDLLSSFPVKRIDNLVDLTLYNRIDNSLAKKVLGFDTDAFIVLFVAVNLRDPLKNLGIVYEAMGKVPFASVLVCVGVNHFFSTIPENVVCLNSVNSEKLMSVIYSATDVFVTPSVQESFGKTTIEALACGTPVISSNTGIAPEVINSDSGIILDAITVDTVAQAIIKARSIHFDRESIRSKVVNRFDSRRIVKQYLELYEGLIARASKSELYKVD